MTNDTSPSPSLMKRVYLFLYRAIFFPPNVFARVLIWTPLLILALIAGSWLAWGLGYLQYYMDGEPNDWRYRQRQQSARLVVGRADFQQVRSKSNNLYGLTELVPEEAFVDLALRSKNFIDHERMVNDFSDLTGEEGAHEEVLQQELPPSLFETINFPMADTEPPIYLRFSFYPLRIAENDQGLISRFQLPVIGFDQTTARSFLLRMRSRYGTATATEGSMDDNNTMHRVMIWRSGDSLVLCEWNEMKIKENSRPEFVLLFTQVTAQDPSFSYLIEHYYESSTPSSSTESEQ